MKDWKEKLDPVIRDYLNDLLKKVQEHREAYSKSKDKRISQLWVALAILYREINMLRNEITGLNAKVENLIEKEKEKEKEKGKKKEKESKIKELIKTLEQF